MQKCINKLHNRETGFTLIELLVVVGILGILAAVAVASFTGSTGDAQIAAYATELRDIQTAVAVMLHESTSGKMESVPTPTDDMAGVHTTGPGVLYLDDYLMKLDSEGKVTLGCTYTFTNDGMVTQILP